MSTTAETRFEQLLSTRAMIGRQSGGGGAWPSAPVQYEFGGGKPDPGSFPYDEIVEATRRMMAAEGAQALTYGEPQGYKGPARVAGPQARPLRGLAGRSRQYPAHQRLLHALGLVISAFVDVGDR
jgi:DNA-binding transcriptional MocR family regulator